MSTQLDLVVLLKIRLLNNSNSRLCTSLSKLKPANSQIQVNNQRHCYIKAQINYCYYLSDSRVTTSDGLYKKKGVLMF